ncbi:TPA: tail fiber protein [Yersinia enterocolitica]|nr:tail fiber protein [Yersinia enterocolitica]HDL6985225.1 tail fiber protein [Yersinia enterocolitica]HDL7067767.1 tail fiber protein [Yersinia enterocolitica]HDL7072155.1 tail fiber protein [Yersinia enterocolitica]
MHRIDTPTAQVDKFGAGKNGFTRGNPQTGVPATALDDDYFDAVQEELAGVVEAAGFVLNKADRAQLLAAIKHLITLGIPDLKDASLTQKGVVQLSSSTTSVSEILAATPKAVKDMGDKALKTTNNLSEIAAAGSVAQSETQANIGLTGGLSAGAIGRLIAKRSITSTGVIPKATGAKWALIRAWSAGGGGGGAGRTVTAGNASQGWAGQSGSFIEVLVDVSGLSNYDCFIGLGGQGGAPSNVNAGNPGLDGGDTIITGMLKCPGGKGGQPGVLGTTNNTGIAIVGTASPTATLGTILDSSISDIGAPGAQVGTGPNQSLGCRGGSAPGGLGSVGGQAGRPIDAGTDGTGGNANGHAAGGGGGSSVSNTTGYGGGNGTGGFISITEFA